MTPKEYQEIMNQRALAKYQKMKSKHFRNKEAEEEEDWKYASKRILLKSNKEINEIVSNASVTCRFMYYEFMTHLFLEHGDFNVDYKYNRNFYAYKRYLKNYIKPKINNPDDNPQFQHIAVDTAELVLYAAQETFFYNYDIYRECYDNGGFTAKSDKNVITNRFHIFTEDRTLIDRSKEDEYKNYINQKGYFDPVTLAIPSRANIDNVVAALLSNNYDMFGDITTLPSIRIPKVETLEILERPDVEDYPVDMRPVAVQFSVPQYRRVRSIKNPDRLYNSDNVLIMKIVYKTCRSGAWNTHERIMRTPPDEYEKLKAHQRRRRMREKSEKAKKEYNRKRYLKDKELLMAKPAEQRTVDDWEALNALDVAIKSTQCQVGLVRLDPKKKKSGKIDFVGLDHKLKLISDSITGED